MTVEYGHRWTAWTTIIGGSWAYVTTHVQLRICPECNARQTRDVDSTQREVARSVPYWRSDLPRTGH